MKFWNWLKGLFKPRKHLDARVYCVNGMAFVKCVDCGHESMPWEVDPSVAKAWTDSHPNALKELVEITEKVAAKRFRGEYSKCPI